MKIDWDDFAVGILVICAVVVTGLVVRRELTVDRGEVRDAREPSVRTVDNWRAYARSGHRLGPDSADVTITEFVDFQCPYCRVLADRLDRLMADRPGDLAVVVRHHPQPELHPAAMKAARASLCAAAQGNFAAFHDALFSRQASLGQVPWRRYAETAGIDDLSAFDACLHADSTLPQLTRDTAAARRLGIEGTPTILINDTLVEGAPRLEFLEKTVAEKLTDARR